MGSLAGKRIWVVGAGVLGLACAAVLSRRGAQVELVEDRPDEANASAMAAGMIAPAMEAALEDATAERTGLYREAARRWPAFAEAFGVRYWCDGTDWRGPGERIASRLGSRGFPFEERPGGLFVPGEARVSPPQALGALSSGLRRSASTVDAVEDRHVRVGGAWIRPDAIVLAAGWRAAAIEGLDPVLRHISPVKGQLILLSNPDVLERTTRGEAVYLVPGEGGVIAGATMEPGLSDTGVDDLAVERLRAAAEGLEPALAGAPLKAARAGVRGATPDGMPMAGSTALEGVFVALAPRRNGWLLAPMVAGIVAAAIAEEAPPEGAEAFRPDRFGPA